MRCWIQCAVFCKSLCCRNKTLRSRLSRASGKIQQIFHTVSVVAAVFMPAKLLEISTFDRYLLICLFRIPDIIVTLLAYICFHCLCYYSA